MTEALFTTKQVKIDTLGEYITSIRKQLNLDLKTVSLLTQIKPQYLEWLEKGNFQKLPADVYVRGFLKSLSDLYHIKERVLVDQYEKERGIGLVKESKTRQKISKLSFTPKNLVIGFSVLAAIVAIVYIGDQIRSVLAPPYLTVSEPTSDIYVEGNSVIIVGKGEIGAQIFINSQPVLVDAEGQFTENLLLSNGLNIVEISERNKFGKVSKVIRQITSNNQAVVPATPQVVNLTVSIGPASAWVSIEADGIVVQKGTMLAGSQKSISAKNEIILTSADAGSTTVVYNGKDLGKLGRDGEVIRNVEFSAVQ